MTVKFVDRHANSSCTHIIRVAEVQAPKDLEDMTFGHYPAQPTTDELQLVQKSVIQELEHQVESLPPSEHFDHVH